MFARLCFVFAVAFLASISLYAAADTATGTTAVGRESRVALVIGNGAYTAIQSAQTIQMALEQVGFVVIPTWYGGGVHQDLTADDLRAVLQAFAEKLTPDTVALFYFAGEGAVVAGEDYMFGVDAGSRGAEDLARYAVSLTQVIGTVAERKARANIFLLDTDRNNPDGLKRIGYEARMMLPPATLVAAATAVGGLAGADPEQPDKRLFSNHLVKLLGDSEQPIEQLLKQVTLSVQSASRGAQEPRWASTLKDSLVLARPEDKAAGAAMIAAKEEVHKAKMKKMEEEFKEAQRQLEQQNSERQLARQRAEDNESAPSSFSFGDFLRGIGKVVGAVGMAAGVRYNDPGMIQQGAALIGGDANEIARTQAAQNARQQAARQAQNSGGAGGRDCAQHWNNAQRASKEREDMKSPGYKGPSGTTGQAGAQNDSYNLHMNAYRACISQ